MSLQFPDFCLYHREALWLQKLEEDEALIGVCHYAQGRLGDVVYVDLPQAGSRLVGGEAFGIIESNKVASDLIAPTSGKIVACNEALDGDPGLVNLDCYGKGWLVRISLDPDWSEGELMSAQDYMRFLGAD